MRSMVEAKTKPSPTHDLKEDDECKEEKFQEDSRAMDARFLAILDDTQQAIRQQLLGHELKPVDSTVVERQ